MIHPLKESFPFNTCVGMPDTVIDEGLSIPGPVITEGLSSEEEEAMIDTASLEKAWDEAH